MPTNIAPFSNPELAFDLSHGTVVNHLHLPVGTDTDRIGMKLDRLTSLVRWAGAKQLVLAGADLGYERPNVFDVEHNGGDTLTAKGLKKAPKQDLHQHVYDDSKNPVINGINFEVEPESTVASYKADSLVLHFDKKGLTDRVIDHRKNKKGPNDEEVWTSVLDSEIRRGIQTAAFDRYINGQRFSAGFEFAANTVYYQWVADYIINGDNVGWASLGISIKTIQLLAQTHRVLTGEATMKDANWTTQIFTKHRTDRAIAAAISSKLGGKTLRTLK